MERDQDGSCAFVAIEEQTPTLYDISYTKLDTDIERITTFIITLLEYSGIKFYSMENFIVETLTYLLLMCDIDVRSKFQLLMYQLHNNYVPWDVEDPLNKDVKSLDFVGVFDSLISILLRLDVNRKVLQCYHCKSKCCCEVVATFMETELNLFTLQDPINQVVDIKAEEIVIVPDHVIKNPINMLSKSFIVDIEFSEPQISSQTNSMHNVLDNVEKEYCEDKEATLPIIHNPSIINPHAWKGHNDDGIPIINFDAMFGHTDYDLDLQPDCKV